MTKLLLVGDSNFIIKHTPYSQYAAVNTSVSLTSELLNCSMHNKNCSKIYNNSVWGRTLLEYYVDNVVHGPLMHWGCDIVVIGFGTNDSNYFYSLNAHICTPSIHCELLRHLIHIYTSTTQVRQIILAPVPPVYIASNSVKDYWTNSMIRRLNNERRSLAKDLNGSVTFLADLNFDKHHLCEDGHHLNHLGLAELAKSIISTISSHDRLVH